MKNYIIFILLIFLSLYSCQKKEIVFTENPSLHHPKVLTFTELSANNPVITPSGKTIINAIAYGDSLKYLWKAKNGSITGNGSEVEYVNPVIGVDTITCEVSDKYGKMLSKQLTITVTSDLVFSSLTASDTLMPLNYQTMLTATASGEGITYLWFVSEGSINGNGAQATFTAPHTGNFEVTCIVKDKYDQTITKKLTLTATNNLIFKSLTAVPQTIHVLENSLITATAFGEGLTYTWTASNAFVTFTGSGSSVYATICHRESFTVYCKVKDNSNNEIEKSILITVID
jgi:hypothetical protein